MNGKKYVLYLVVGLGILIAGMWIGSSYPETEEVQLDTPEPTEQVADTTNTLSGWALHTSPDDEISFQVPDEYLVSFESGIISEHTGEDQYFPLTSFRYAEASDPLSAYHVMTNGIDIDLDITVIPHTIYEGITVLRVEIPAHPPIRDLPYTHSVYIASSDDNTRHYLFTGWEDFSIAYWDHLVPFLGSIQVN